MTQILTFTIEAVGLLVLLIGAFAAVSALSKARGIEASVDLLTTANDGLREANADLERQIDNDRAEFRDRLHTQELDCSTQIAELRGRISALTNGIATEIVDAVLLELRKEIAP